MIPIWLPLLGRIFDRLSRTIDVLLPNLTSNVIPNGVEGSSNMDRVFCKPIRFLLGQIVTRETLEFIQFIWSMTTLASKSSLFLEL